MVQAIGLNDGALVSITSIIGYVFGFLGAMIWNRLLR